MALFGIDPKDQLIAFLQGQIEAKDLRIMVLEKQLLALTDKAAYALTNPREHKPAAPPPVESREPYRPQASKVDIEKTFQRN